MNLGRQTRPVLENQWYLTLIGDKIKLTHLYQVMESGWEELNPKQDRNVNVVKLRQHISRAREMVYQYSMCNNWDFFFTGTLSPEKRDRSDLQSFEKAFGQMVRDYRRRKGIDIQYLIVPELHADLENWHCHGLIKGLPESELISFAPGKLSWLKYFKNFGFNDLSAIKNHEAVSKYLTKYITKTFDDSRGVTEKERNMYLVSRGLKKGETIKKGSIAGTIEQAPKFENEFCQVYEFEKSDLDFLLSLYEERD